MIMEEAGKGTIQDGRCMGEPVVVVARQPAISLIILELVQQVLLRPWAGLLLPRHTLEPALRFLPEQRSEWPSNLCIK